MSPSPTSLSTVTKSGLKSLSWLLFFMAMALFLSQLSNILYVDVMHDNPYRPLGHALMLPFLSTPILLLIFSFLAVIFLAAPLALQTLASYISLRLKGPEGLPFSLLFLPLSAWVGWYCYNYGLPHDLNFGFNEGPDWKPYSYEITLLRYLASLATGAVLTAFVTLRLYWELTNQPQLMGRVMFALSALISVGVIFLSYHP